MATRLALPARLVLGTTAVAALAAVAYVCRRRIIRIAYRIVGANEPFMVTIAAKGFRRKHTVFMTVRRRRRQRGARALQGEIAGRAARRGRRLVAAPLARIGDEVTITVGRREMQDNGQELLHIASATIEQMCVASNVGFTRFVPPPSSELPPPPPPPPPPRPPPPTAAPPPPPLDEDLADWASFMTALSDDDDDDDDAAEARRRVERRASATRRPRARAPPSRRATARSALASSASGCWRNLGRGCSATG